MAEATQEPDLETLRFAADPHWFGRAPGLAALDKLYRAGRTGLYLSLSLYWWLGSRFGGPRSGGKLGLLRRAMQQRSARKRAEQRSPELLLVRDTAQVPEGQPIAVRGTVRARRLLAAELHGEGTVHHRVDLELEFGQQPGRPLLAVRKYDHLVYEAGCDFDDLRRHVGTRQRTTDPRAQIAHGLRLQLVDEGRPRGAARYLPRRGKKAHSPR